MEDAPLRIILQIAVPISAPGDAISVPITGYSGGGGGHTKVLIFAGILVVLLTAQSQAASFSSQTLVSLRT